MVSHGDQLPEPADRPADDDLASVHSRLAAIVESSSDAIIAMDLDGIITAWNPAAERLYGYAAAEMLGESIQRLIPPDISSDFDFVIAQVSAGAAVPAFDTERLTKSGERICVAAAVSPIRDAEGAVVGCASSCRDITERHALERQRALTELVIEHSADGICVLDLEGRVTLWNPAAEAMFGIPAADIVGRDPAEVIPTDDPAQYHRRQHPVLYEGKTVRYEATRRRRDGSEFTANISLSPLHDASGAITGGIAMIRDTTEAREAERRMAAAAEREASLERELEQVRRLESVGQLAGGIAHDFNNLLGVILNLSLLVSTGLPEDSQARQDVDEIGATAQRAATLTRQLLIFSRRDVAEPEVLDPCAVVEDLRGLLGSAVPARIALEINCADDGWRTVIDRGQLEQVVVNLVFNARDSIAGAGRIVVEVSNTIVDTAFAETQTNMEPGTYVTVSVGDTGAGMPRDVVERAFEPFFTTKPVGQGSGLGLSTVYGIAQAAGGRVGLYTEEGHGTTVKVHLPAADAPAEVVASAQVAPRAGLGECVALVEDHPDLRRITARILSTAGYDVIAAEDAAEAMRLLSITPTIDALVTDVIMPGRSGVELADQLRAIRPELAVLFVSGYSHSLLTGAALAQPRTAFLEKPFTAAALQQVLRALLDGKPAAPAA